MKRLAFLALALLLSGGQLYAERRKVDLGSDQQGAAISPRDGGARYYRLTSSTEANPVDGPVVILAVQTFNTGTAATTAYAQLRDTDIGSDATVNIVGKFRYMNDSGASPNALAFPLYLESGFAVDQISTNGASEEVVVTYIDARDFP